MNGEKKVLNIGPLPPRVGGTTVLFKQLAEDLCKNSKCHSILNSNQRTPLKFAIFFAKAVCEILFNSKIRVVALHCSNGGLFYLGPIFYALSRLSRKKFVVRKFGGNLAQTYIDAGPFWKRVLAHSVFRADIFYVETKLIISKLSHVVPALTWYPNSRRISEFKPKVFGNSLRFIYLGAVNRPKGVHTLIEAFNEYKGPSTLSIYGRCEDHTIPTLIKSSNVSYHGEVAPEQVADVLSEHDVLILPSAYFGEGYPGVVLEAFAAGLPVIACDWFAISELVNPKNGFLISDNRSAQILEAVKRAEESRQSLTSMSQNAYEFVRQFDRDLISAQYIRELEKLCDR